MQFNSRKWHNWISVILVLPILIVSLTAVFIAHNKALRLEERDISAAVGWLPGYGVADRHGMETEIRASLLDARGGRWIAGKASLYQLKADRLLPVPELMDTQVRDLVEAPFGLVAATKDGVWVLGPTGWQRRFAGDAWSASLSADGAVAVTLKDQGLVMSRDGSDWVVDAGITSLMVGLAPEQVGTEKITLHKLVMDLHTGKAFLGKAREWLWIDLVGLVMTFLSITGVYLWWRGERRRQALS